MSDTPHFDRLVVGLLAVLVAAGVTLGAWDMYGYVAENSALVARWTVGALLLLVSGYTVGAALHKWTDVLEEL